LTQGPDPLVNIREMGLYRPNVGLAIFSRRGHVLLGHRASSRKSEIKYAWQMPQGGIDRGESAAEAAIRELGEETGLAETHVEFLEEIEPWLFYDFPPELKARLQGPFYGQRQKWFAYRFTGSDTDIRLDLHTPEFDSWRWAQLSEAPDLVIPFKQPVYREVAKRFERWTQPV
jgi:putative (di)nucleoside polyphosphate hydrolase